MSDLTYQESDGASTPVSPTNPLPAGIRTFKHLDDIITILGSTKTTLFPFLESYGGVASQSQIYSYKENQHLLFSRDETAARNLESEFSPYRHAGGVHSYQFTAAGNQYLQGTDDANLGFPANADFSCGAWILPRDITGVTIMGKYDLNAQREWRLSLDASSKIELEVYDESNNQDRTGASDTAVSADEWALVVATTDNNDSDASMKFYLNGVADGSGNTESGAAYANSPDTSSTFVIGASLNTAPLVAALFDGLIALPFVCGKELTAVEVLSIYNTGRVLLGLA